MAIINLKYIVAGDHLENIVNSVIVRRGELKDIFGGKGHAVTNRLAQNCESGKSLVYNVCRKCLYLLSSQTAGCQIDQGTAC